MVVNHYWDLYECRWVEYQGRPMTAVVPAQRQEPDTSAAVADEADLAPIGLA
jgi:hypothetical protein